MGYLGVYARQDIEWGRIGQYWYMYTPPRNQGGRSWRSGWLFEIKTEAESEAQAEAKNVPASADYHHTQKQRAHSWLPPA